jgi:ribonuclease E
VNDESETTGGAAPAGDATPPTRSGADAAGASAAGASGGSAEPGDRAQAGSTDAEAGGPGSPGGPQATEGGPPRPKRRRGRRGGKRHKKRPATAGGTSAEGDDEADSAEGSETGPAAKPDGSTSSPSRPRRTQPARPRGTPASGRRPSTPRARPAAAGGDPTDGKSASESAEARSPEGDGSATAAADAPASTPAAGAVESGDAEAAAPAGDGTTPAARKRRRRRGGRGRGGRGGTRPAGTTPAADGEPADGEPADGEAEEGASEPRPQPKPARAPRQRRPAAATTAAEGDEAASGEPAPPAPAKAGGRGRTGAPKADASKGGSTRLDARAQRSRQRPRRPPRRLTGEEAKQLRGSDKVMVIHEHGDRIQIAVLEGRTLIEHYVAHGGGRSIAGNVYLGRVQNVLAGMEAAFVDIGKGRNAVLYAGEVNYSAEDLEGETQPRIEKILKPGQPVLVQVTKDPLGTKGARLTAQISLAGRYMVLAPEQQLSGISRRLAEEERARLRQIVRGMRPNGHGVIVRTAAEGASAEALKRDLDGLLKIWGEIKTKQKKEKAPALLYAEPELVTRVVRDIFSGDFAKVVVDSKAIHTKLVEYLEDSGPDLLERLDLHEGPLSILEQHHVVEQIQKALERKVWLPSGGSIVIDRTEAMTVIDVNTAKFVGKGGSLEETVFKNNLEAAEEVARQLRLRDIGGIIVIDFIDMILPSNREQVLRTLKRALSRDKTRSQVFEVSSLGLVEMTRKKVSEGLLEAFSEPCPNCEGRGIVITHEID